jgi:SHS2 domain-containing protein
VPYQTTDHTADLGIIIQADSLEALFTEAARALSELIFAERPLTTSGELNIDVSGSDWPDLMINWLRELLYLWNGKSLIIGPARIRKIEPFTLEAAVKVDNTLCDPHDIVNEIKAVTYHAIEAARTTAGWQARIIFDI